MNKGPNAAPQPIIRIGSAAEPLATLELFDAKAAHPDNSVVATGFYRGMPVIAVVNSKQPNGDPMTPRLEVFRTGAGAPIEPVAVARPTETWSESPQSDPWAHEFHDTLTFHLRKTDTAEGAYPWVHTHGICMDAMPKDLHDKLGFRQDLVRRPANAINPPTGNSLRDLFQREEPAGAEAPRG
ncbi:hypothetical protein [Variovorax sp. LjRoot178]|uniref:hypothetical protein n=1 Tax=Variovorax sp. LjRoot178 TaxID=3342277 RepID=UPI003ECE841E